MTLKQYLQRWECLPWATNREGIPVLFEGRQIRVLNINWDTKTVTYMEDSGIDWVTFENVIAPPATAV